MSPDRRRHRSAAPADAELFAPEELPRLRTAAEELAWLLERGYPEAGAAKLVGDRHGLRARQRTALSRAVCPPGARSARLGRRRAPSAGERVAVDGFNLLTTVESALGGGVVLLAQDGCARDLASLHGTWRRVEETPRALDRCGQALASRAVGRVAWYLDAPVSNSGRLAAMLRETAGDGGWDWEVGAVPDADAAVLADGGLVVSADRGILDRCGAWWNLAREIVEEVEGAWRVDLSP